MYLSRPLPQPEKIQTRRIFRRGWGKEKRCIYKEKILDGFEERMRRGLERDVKKALTRLKKKAESKKVGEAILRDILNEKKEIKFYDSRESE